MLVDPQDLERIAKQALRELGEGDVDVVVEPEAGSDRWRITARGRSPASFVIRCGRGTTAQFVRTQIFEKFQRH